VAIPREFEATLATIGLDWLFSDAYPLHAAMALDYMRSVNGDSVVAYRHLSEICFSLTSTCKFLSNFAELVSSCGNICMKLFVCVTLWRGACYMFRLY
jgi:hypothetical protein